MDGGGCWVTSSGQPETLYATHISYIYIISVEYLLALRIQIK